MTTPDDTTPEAQADPQTHLDTDPANDPGAGLTGSGGDAEDDPAHDTGEDEGWTSEGGATESGPATDT